MAITTSSAYEDMVERVHQYVRHPYLVASGVEPAVSRFHFDVASALLSAAAVPAEQAVQITDAVMLLHQGLAIHDIVDEVEDKRQQLTVLAGDFSSGHYYDILARLEDPSLLSALCDAVVEINEAKMSLLLSPSLTSEEQAELYEVAHGGLLFALAKHFFPGSAKWQNEIQALVTGYIANENVMHKCTDSPSHIRQTSVWLSDVVERLVKTQTNSVLKPISSFLLDYVRATQKKLESQSITEGN